MQIGNYTLANPLILAPMAGISDLPFRELCKQHGAGLAVSEMVASNPVLREHRKTQLKAQNTQETGLRSVQILGTDPQIMAQAARYNAERGADIIDINMGCPAKKVCAVAAGSALLRDEALVKRILDAVVNAVNIPVTLKIRTGWDKENRNALTIATIAEQAGIAALTIHGRTRACKFNGDAEYDTIKQVKQAVNIPIIANGDIDCAQKAAQVLADTGADAIMIGRAARGNPWLFAQIKHYLKQGSDLAKPSLAEVQQNLNAHLEALYGFYGDEQGVRIARKHIAWYLTPLNLGELPAQINQAQRADQQLECVNAFICSKKRI
ncbi:MAG: tRNA dihydrouridine synthase DusB [Methylococcaceae bacterium]